MLKSPALRVVKVGGNELDRPGWLDALARSVAAAGPVVIVHGGGRAISALSARLGLPVEKRDGLRVTSSDVVTVVEMVLAGPVSRAIVAALHDAGIDAVGVSGVDGGLLVAERYDERLGAVGRISKVRPDLLTALLIAGFTPVVAPIAPGADGALLNVNADDAAAAIAASLSAAELLFVSDVPGVELDGVTVPEMTPAEVESSISRGSVTGGMAAKLRAAAVALGTGVQRVRIGGLDMLVSGDAGTRLVPTTLSAPVPA
jgi:acetylglutamate kinase